MLDYVQPIGVALIIFAIIAIIIFIPWLFYIYRKLGFFPVSSTLIVFSFIFYFLAAFLLTMLPLPETRNNCIAPSTNSGISLAPFQFIRDLLRETNVQWSQSSTYVYLLKERAFFQAFFNLLLLMPLGIYLRYFFQARKRWLKTLLIVFSVTFLYEITQLTGIYGIYDCSYRLFDVDDLMLNTVGGMLGFFIAPILLALFPSRANIQQKAEELVKKDEVRNMPILLAMLVDIGVVQLSSTIIAAASSSWDVWSMLIIHSIMLYVFLVFVPARLSGQTLGGKLMRFRYSSPQLTRKLIKRMLAIFLVYAVSFVAQIFNRIDTELDSSMVVLSIILAVVGWIISLSIAVVLLIHCFIVLTSKGERRFFFDIYGGLTATRKPPDKLKENTSHNDGNL